MSQLVPRSSGDEGLRSRRNVGEFREFVLEGLEPATEYILRVTVESFGKISYSPDATFETREYRFYFLIHRVYRTVYLRSVESICK